MRYTALILLVVASLAACGDDEAAPATSVPPDASAAVDSTPPSTDTPVTASTTDTGSVAPPTSAESPTSTERATEPTTEPCQAPTSTETVSVGFPNTLSSLVGSEIRTGSHTCFERVVLELQGDGTMPGYRVQYVDDPVRLSPSDLEVDIAGDATLVLSVGAWMTTMDGGGYQGPDQIIPSNVADILELRLVENFEGMHQWAIGLDQERAFTVTTLSGPPRIVIDIAR
jgi:hypothetical protein